MSDKCIAPEKIKEGDLLAFIADEATAAVSAHLAECDYCQAEVSALREASGLLSAAAYRQDCPDVDLLLQFEAGLLSQAEAKPVQAHLSGCDLCQVEMAQLTAVPAAAGADNSWGKQLQEGGRRMLEAIRQPLQQPVTAVRGRSQHQTYLIAGYKIVLAVNSMYGLGMRWEVDGQVMLDADPLVTFQGRATLMDGEKAVATDELDEFGYFLMDNVKPGAFMLQIDLAEDTLLIKDLSLLPQDDN